MDGLVVCHTGTEWGLGHLTRCFHLIKAFQESTFLKCKLLIQGPHLKKNELDFISHQFILKKDILTSEFFQIVFIENPKFIIFDIPFENISTDFLKCLTRLKSLKIKIIGIDSLLSYTQYCDLVHMPTFWVDPSKLTNAQCPVSYGWDSYLLSPSQKYKSWQPGNKIIILTGGSDVDKLGETLPCELDAMLPLGLEIHWIKGPYANTPHLPSVPRLGWIIEDSPENLVELMGEMHYALTVFGVSFFELLRTGIPTVVFSPYGNKDQTELTKINEENLCYVADDQSNAVQSLVKLMRNNNEAHLFSERSQHKLHINGTEKLIAKIASLVSES